MYTHRLPAAPGWLRQAATAAAAAAGRCLECGSTLEASGRPVDGAGQGLGLGFLLGQHVLAAPAMAFSSGLGVREAWAEQQQTLGMGGAAARWWVTSTTQEMWSSLITLQRTLYSPCGVVKFQLRDGWGQAEPIAAAGARLPPGPCQHTSLSYGHSKGRGMQQRLSGTSRRTSRCPKQLPLLHLPLLVRGGWHFCCIAAGPSYCCHANGLQHHQHSSLAASPDQPAGRLQPPLGSCADQQLLAAPRSPPAYMGLGGTRFCRWPEAQIHSWQQHLQRIDQTQMCGPGW